MNNYINPNQQLVTGGAQFNPYMTTAWPQTNRLPVYAANPIHGKDAAWQFPMGPSSEIYLPDADQDLIWWIRTDNMGNRTVIPFDIMPHEEPTPISLEDIMARLDTLEDKINAKQNKSNAKRSNAPVATTGNSIVE